MRIAAPELAARLGLSETPTPRGNEDATSAARWFRLGCQGPDIFYHNQRTKPSGLHYGSLAHRRNYGLLVEGALCAYLGARITGMAVEQDGELPEPAFAYLLGFATHAALDRAAHPFIVFFSGWAGKGPQAERFRGCHPFLERLLDLALLHELRGLGPADFDLEALLPLDGRARGAEARTEESVVALLTQGLATAYPKAAGTDFLLARRLENALSDARYFFRATNPARTAGARADYFAYLDDRAGPRSIALVYPEALPSGIDILNRRRRAWRHPADDGRFSDEDFFALYLRGVAESARVLERMLRLWREPPEADEPCGLAGLVGNGGLSITNEAGIPVSPQVAEPLPLAGLMDEEYRKRLELARRALAADPSIDSHP